MSSIWYVYPTHHIVSFTFIAKEHIRLLKRRWPVQEVPEKGFLDIVPSSRPTVFIHPLLYLVSENYDRFVFMRTKYRYVIGVEVADSDRISNLAANAVNAADAVILPTNWCKEAYRRSGVRVPIHVVPHGLRKIFYRPKGPPKHDVIQEALKLKQKHNLVFFCFFCWHSPRRKGYDLVIDVMKEVQKTHKNAMLFVWEGAYMKDFSDRARLLKSMIITGWVETDVLVEMLDISDIYLLFSRGGAFEMAGLEALARGCIVVASDGGAWAEYLPKESLVPPKRFVPVFYRNPFHTGRGPEIDVEKAVDRIHDILNDLDDWKARYREHMERIRREYSWDAIAPKLYKVVERYV